MDVESVRSLKPELDLFLTRYLPHFGREENHRHAAVFLHGLLEGGDRRNVENIAERIDGPPVRTLQKFVGQASWRDRDALDELRRHVVEELGEEGAVLNVDETGFPKKGTKSVGVQRRYSGTLGGRDDCQVGVFVNYCSSKGHVLIDRRLYLPESWADDAERREEAGVPQAAVFRTKPELALAMVGDAAAAGMPFRWVGGDCVYGDSPTFVQGIEALGKLYVLDASSHMHAWTEDPHRRAAADEGPGRPRTRPSTKPRPLPAIAATLPASAWKRVAVAEGSQGPRTYEYAEITVWFSVERKPAARPERLLVRRSLDQEPEMKFQRSNAPASVPLAEVAAAGGCRWSVEQDFQAGKGECGLDEYETRGWVGWHHHTALSMLSLWFPSLQKRRLGEKKSTDVGARSKGGAADAARPAALGRRRDRTLVESAAESQPRRGGMPSPTTRRQAASAPRRTTSAE